MNWLGWSLLSAFFAGLTAVLAKLGVEQVNSHLATAIRTTVILVITWTIAVLALDTKEWAMPNSRTWFFLIASGCATGLSWLCYFRALQLGEVVKVAPIDKLGVVFAAVLALIFLNERLGARELAGIGLILVGAILMASK
jgi:bacterial/archaeal transporter family protein